MNECESFPLILQISVVQSLQALFNGVSSAPVEKLSFKIKPSLPYLLIYYSWPSQQYITTNFPLSCSEHIWLRTALF